MDSDYAAKVFHFVKDKSVSELNLFHWKRNFDLYTLVHSSFNFWSDRSVTITVIKSHSLERTHHPLVRYHHLGNEFADLAAKTVAKDQGIVEFFQTRSSLWTYTEKAESEWKFLYEWCYGVAQRFLNADELGPSLFENTPNANHATSDPQGQPVEPPSESQTLRHFNLDLFDLGDPVHRRRQMSSYGATYNRCLFAFLTSIQVTFLELYLGFLHCFGMKVGVRTQQKYPSFQSPSLFEHLEDQRVITDELRTFISSVTTLES